ncbi:unnamed protein product [Adineta steineri]|uniref:Uncharacterized protein n=2 Tax=Adineta steineri TaxID=433720 RepID=A0A818N5H6_9BILA|nr:unnamed protein product [Adineta steineri]
MDEKFAEIHTSDEVNVRLEDNGRTFENFRFGACACAVGIHSYSSGIHSIRIKIRKGNPILGIHARNIPPIADHYSRGSYGIDPSTYGFEIDLGRVLNGRLKRKDLEELRFGRTDIVYTLILNCDEHRLINNIGKTMMIKNTIIWLDANSSDPESSFHTKLGNVQTFIDVQDCIKYIQSYPNESIYLIVSGSFAKLVTPEIYDCSNLIQIFLFCGSVSTYAEWAMDYCDKIMIFDHGDDLLERLWNDVESNLRKQANLYLKYAEEYKQRALKYKQSACG